MPYFDVSNLSIRLGDEIFSYNFSIFNRGSCVGIFGKSGMGKTSFFRAICGLEKPISGSIFLDSEDITFKKTHKRKISYIFQDSALLENRTAKKNISFVCK